MRAKAIWVDQWESQVTAVWDRVVDAQDADLDIPQVGRATQLPTT